VDLTRVIDSAVRLVQTRAEEAGIAIDIEKSAGLPNLQADERLLKQIVLNLLTNSIKFTPDRGRITIRTEVNGDKSLALIISDTGVGIAPKDMSRVFVPFQQVDGSLARKHEGTGLGLPLVKSLTELHGGKLHLESEVGVGTTVTVWFPPDRVLHSLGDESAERSTG
jgi:signal transduction histidine kinase